MEESLPAHDDFPLPILLIRPFATRSHPDLKGLY
jgi:hypothetical protein